MLQAALTSALIAPSVVTGQGLNALDTLTLQLIAPSVVTGQGLNAPGPTHASTDCC
jgi:hypothetical protein